MLVAATVLTGCSGNDEGFVVLDDMAVSSADIADGRPIPPRHTCDGDDRPPSLTWSGTPEDTEEIVVLVTDSDADGFVHWAVAGIDPQATSLSDGVGVQGTNGFGRVGYGGPCPPDGDEPHSYVFNVYALADGTGLDEGFAGEQLPDSLGEAIGAGSITATYRRR